MKIKVFFRRILLTRTWNNGKMEQWNDDLKKMTFLDLIPVNRNVTITQLLILPEPNVPVFHYSNCDLPARALQWQAGRIEPSSVFNIIRNEPLWFERVWFERGQQ
jgi:hypothetical protein